MAYIILERTDDSKVHAGYCSKCGAYNEVWTFAKTTKCHRCKSIMHHIKEFHVLTFIIITIFTLFIIFVFAGSYI